MNISLETIVSRPATAIRALTAQCNRLGSVVVLYDAGIEEALKLLGFRVARRVNELAYEVTL